MLEQRRKGAFERPTRACQSTNTGRTHGNGLAYLAQYLEEQYGWLPTTRVAELRPEMCEEFPAWLLAQRYSPDRHTAPTPLAESTRALYLTAVTRFLHFLVLRKRLPQ